jgi:hypothetical protein
VYQESEWPYIRVSGEWVAMYRYIRRVSGHVYVYQEREWPCIRVSGEWVAMYTCIRRVSGQMHQESEWPCVSGLSVLTAFLWFSDWQTPDSFRIRFRTWFFPLQQFWWCGIIYHFIAEGSCGFLHDMTISETTLGTHHTVRRQNPHTRHRQHRAPTTQ